MQETDHRKSLIGLFAVAFVLTFFVDHEKGVELNFWGLRITEGYIWLSLAMAQVYFSIMAYTVGVYGGVPKGKGIIDRWEWVTKDRSRRPARWGLVMRTYFPTGIAVLSTLLILWGCFQAYTSD